MNEIELAKWLHDNYEEVAKNENWDTQENCKVDFDSLPDSNKQTMIKIAYRLLNFNLLRLYFISKLLSKDKIYRIIKGDEVNCIHAAIMRELSGEQRIVLRDKLIRRTPPVCNKECKCIQCGCVDSSACSGGCHWIWVDREKGTGLCSQCKTSHS